jgi:hypothetical protein
VRYVSSTGIPHLVYIPTLVDFDYTKPWFLEWYCKTDLKPAAFLYVSHACCTVSIEYGKVSLYFPLLGWVSQDYNAIAANQWYKFRLSYDGINKWELYIDDVLLVPNEYQNYSYDAQGEPENIQFWANTDGFSDHEALVDEVKIYGFPT